MGMHQLSRKRLAMCPSPSSSTDSVSKPSIFRSGAEHLGGPSKVSFHTTDSDLSKPLIFGSGAKHLGGPSNVLFHKPRSLRLRGRPKAPGVSRNILRLCFMLSVFTIAWAGGTELKPEIRIQRVMRRL